MISQVAIGDILLVALPDHVPGGREQDGARPAIVVGVPVGTVRYPVVIVVPLTTQSGSWARQNPVLYPYLSPGTGGLPRVSVALLDQIRALDVHRVAAYLGTLSPGEWEPIRDGLKQVMKF